MCQGKSLDIQVSGAQGYMTDRARLKRRVETDIGLSLSSASAMSIARLAPSKPCGLIPLRRCYP
jgi:hypothetical protein